MDDETPRAELPRRPRVLPGLAVLRRRPDEIQVGLDPHRATVIGGLPESVVAAVGTLRGHRTTEDLLTELGPDPAGRAALRDLLAGLVAKGLVRDAAAGALPSRLIGEETVHTGHPAGRRTAAVAVHGDGRLAVSIACLLTGAGVGWVHVAARGAVQPEDTGTGYGADDVGRARATAATQALRRVDASVRTGRFSPRRRPDLVLLTDAMVPDPDLVDVLTADGLPHLVVHIRDGVGVVGPLVVPGLTSCLRCADLHRAQLDACWPGIATQLAGRPQLADLACTQATAGFAAAQALATLRWSRAAHPRPRTWNASVEIDPTSLRSQFRGWRPHPACPCGARVASPTSCP
jgi:bacteriocin biosynthesis cyclodehydratase domain-containing protein